MQRIAVAILLLALGLGAWFFGKRWYQASPDAHYATGVSLKSKGDAASAEREFRAALQIKTNHSPSLNGLGELLKARQDLAQAEKCFREAIAADSKHVRAISNLATLLDETGRRDEATPFWKQARKLEKDPPKLYRIRQRLDQSASTDQ